MVVVGFGHAHKATCIGPVVGQSLDSLVAPDLVVLGGLVCVQETINFPVLIVPPSIHEAHSVERGLYLLCSPEVLKQGPRQLPELPLCR